MVKKVWCRCLPIFSCNCATSIKSKRWTATWLESRKRQRRKTYASLCLPWKQQPIPVWKRIKRLVWAAQKLSWMNVLLIRKQASHTTRTRDLEAPATAWNGTWIICLPLSALLNWTSSKPPLLEGRFGDMKQKLRCHQGMRKENKIRFIKDYFSRKNLNST